eukprot:IDg8112t1
MYSSSSSLDKANKSSRDMRANSSSFVSKSSLLYSTTAARRQPQTAAQQCEG